MSRGAFTIGADPEMFLSDDMTGEYVSAIPLIAGTKDKPEPLGCGSNIQHDNVAMEFGVLPAMSAKAFVEIFKLTLGEIKGRLSEINVSMKCVPSANFPEKELDCEEAKQFGCDPDYNAYTGQRNRVADGASSDTFRSCGGHVHVGYITDSGNDFLTQSIESRQLVIQMMDVFLGLAATVLDDSAEAIERRKLYGKAGCYRPTDYGVEYRTLSNFWVKSPNLVSLIHSLTDDALRCIRENNHVKLLTACHPNRVQYAINNGDVKLAFQIIGKFVQRHFSSRSKELFMECCNNIRNYNFDTEWGA